MPKLATDKTCTGCLACKDICSKKAIQIVLKNGLTHIEINFDRCIECKACERVCPAISTPKRNAVENEQAFGGWVKDENLRSIAASGGAFAGLALNFWDCFKDSVIVGASLQKNRVQHILIENTKDLPLLMNSKYVQSNTDGIYNKVLAELKKGRYVLFSGLPCQVAALQKFIEKRKTIQKQLYTVELICHGVASQEALDLHLEYYQAEEIIQFRNKNAFKETGSSQCSTLKINGKNKVINRKGDIFYNIFSSWLLDRKSCNNCQFARLDRVADITIGDFWGHADAHSKGVSLIIANNSHGLELVKASTHLHIWETTLFDAFNTNVNLWTGWKAIQWHPMVLYPNWFRNHLSEKQRLAILTRKDKFWLLVWSFFKILTIIHIKIKRIYILKRYKYIFRK